MSDPTQALHWQKAGGWFAIASAVVGFYAGAATIWTKETVGFDLPVGEYVAEKINHRTYQSDKSGTLPQQQGQINEDDLEAQRTTVSSE